MKKTFGDFLGEGHDEWLKKMTDTSGMSDTDKRTADALAGDRRIGADMPSQKLQDSQVERIKQRSADMKQGLTNGPAINDLKVVLERLQKMEKELDSFASEVEHDMDPSEVARELDGLRRRMTGMVRVLNKAWTHLAVGGKDYR